jgi:hypothetical protein
VQLLLDAGVDANESIGAESPLASAIGMEHVVLFNLLLERGADLDSPGTAEECVRRAKKDGLESMLTLLEEHGVDIAKEPVSRCVILTSCSDSIGKARSYSFWQDARRVRDCTIKCMW